MRICVFGAGAIGGLIAARLAIAGEEVTVIGCGPQLEAIKTRGIRLHWQDRSVEIARQSGRDCVSRRRARPGRAGRQGAFARASCDVPEPGVVRHIAATACPWARSTARSASASGRRRVVRENRPEGERARQHSRRNLVESLGQSGGQSDQRDQQTRR